PLKLNKVHFINSKTNDVVQIADLIAGAINHYARAMVSSAFEDELSEMISKSKVASLLLSPVWPHKGFDPKEMNTAYTGGNNILDSMADILSKKK
ncbi:MAG TPA: DUF3800 domain-containing protein, partial [Bacteroidia bacterium]